MVAKLVRLVADNLGAMHRPGEVIQIKSTVRQAVFSDNTLVKVVFTSTNTEGAVFPKEFDFDDE